jgi:hypothetical protein
MGAIFISHSSADNAAADRMMDRLSMRLLNNMIPISSSRYFQARPGLARNLQFQGLAIVQD